MAGNASGPVIVGSYDAGRERCPHKYVQSSAKKIGRAGARAAIPSKSNRDQKSKRSASCINRELPFMLVMVPNCPEFKFPVGKPKLGWFSRLKKSARS